MLSSYLIKGQINNSTKRHYIRIRKTNKWAKGSINNNTVIVLRITNSIGELIKRISFAKHWDLRT